MSNQKYSQENLVSYLKQAQPNSNHSFEHTVYEGYYKKITVTCHEVDSETGEEHGDFQISIGHYMGGQGCPKCRYIKASKTKSHSIEDLKKDLEGSKFIPDYSTYVNYKNKMKFTCSEHGDFWMTPNNMVHYHQGCPVCGHERTVAAESYTEEQWIEKAREKHKDRYKYLGVIRKENGKKFFKAVCPKHGEFIQECTNHLSGQGCPICKESKLEKYVAEELDNAGIQYIRQYRPDFLGRQSLDFYLPDYHAAIECQGKQHYIEESFGSKSADPAEYLKLMQERDRKKKELCESNAINVFYYTDYDCEASKNDFKSLSLLLEAIRKE